MKKLQKNIKSFASYATFAFMAVFGLVASGAVATPAYAAEQCPDSSATGSSLTIGGGVSCAKGNGQAESLFGQGGMFQVVTNVMLFLIGAVSVIMLIIGGIRYTISNGDQGAVQSAKNTIMYAIIGLIVALLAYAIVGFVTNSFVSQN